MSSPESRAVSVESLADEYLDRLRRGENPGIEDYADRFPQLADEIRAFFPTLQLVERFKPDERDEASAEIRAEKLASTERESIPSQLGDYHILREVARGGMGVVYEAAQESLGRTVALKVLPAGALADARRKQRFQREARAAARLHHTNIVPVFGVGEADGVHYYAMQFIHGLGLDQVLEEIRRLRAAGAKTAVPTKSESVKAAAKTMAAATVVAGGPPRDGPTAEYFVRSLASGQFELQEFDDGAESGSGDADSRGFTVTPQPDQSAESDSRVAAGDTDVGLLSDTADYALPGQEKSSSGASSVTAYWHSVARIGAQVADALQYAHDNGILHRDVKPSNLLLDARGTAWITDFGLAKADDHDNLTRTGDVVGTLRYMAPELFNGTSDARSDVYSLGLTLYELLALKPAFNQSNRHALIQQVMNDAPARLRSVDRHIPRDLEIIVHKATERDPRHRYQSAGELAADLRRYVCHEPIAARRPTVWQRTSKWARRHRAIVISSVAATLVVVISTFVVLLRANHRIHNEQLKTKTALEDTRQALDEADANFELAFRAVEETLAEAGIEFNGVPHLDPIRRAMLEKALQSFEKLAAKRSNDRRVRFRTAQAAERVGRIRENLGHNRRARQAFDDALRMMDELIAAHPDVAKYRFGRAVVLRNRSLLLYRLGRPQGARRDLEAAVHLLKTAADSDAEDRHRRYELAQTLGSLSVLLRPLGEWAKAEALNREEIDICRELRDQYPDASEYVIQWLQSRMNLAQLLGTRKRWAEAASTSQSVVVDLRAFARDHPRNRIGRRNLGIALMNQGVHLIHTKELRRAEAVGRESVDVLKSLIEDFPDRHAYLSHLVAAHESLAKTYESLKRPKSAEMHYSLAIDTAESLAKRLPDVAIYQSALAAALNNAANGLKNNPAHRSEAEAWLRRAIKVRRNAIRLGDDTQESRTHLYRMHRNLTKLLCESREYEKAAEAAAAHFEAAPPTWGACQKTLVCLNVVCRSVDRDQKLSAIDRTLGSFAWQARSFGILFDQPAISVQNHKERRDLLAARRFLADRLRGTAYRLERGRQWKQAIQARRMSVQALRVLVKEDPKDPDHARDVIGAQYELARLLSTANQTAESTKLMVDVIRQWRDWLERKPRDGVAFCHLGRTLSTRARQLVRTKRFHEACELLEESIRCERNALKHTPNYKLARRLWQGSAGLLVEVLVLADRHEEAIKRAVEIRAAHEDDWSGVSHAMLVLKNQALRIAADTKLERSQRAKWIAQYDTAISSLLKNETGGQLTGARRLAAARQMKTSSRQFAIRKLPAAAAETARLARLLQRDSAP